MVILRFSYLVLINLHLYARTHAYVHTRRHSIHNTQLFLTTIIHINNIAIKRNDVVFSKFFNIHFSVILLFTFFSIFCSGTFISKIFTSYFILFYTFRPFDLTVSSPLSFHGHTTGTVLYCTILYCTVLYYTIVMTKICYLPG